MPPICKPCGAETVAAVKLLKRARRGLTEKVQAAAYNNPLYQKILEAGPAPPGRLHFTLPDLWPGDAQAGLALIGAQGALFGPAPPQQPATALRNLRAVGTDAARQTALRLIGDWLDRFDHWGSTEWSPARLGDRIAGWISFYEFYAPAASPALLARLTASLQRQHRHLLRTMPPRLTGVANLRAVRGLIWGGLNFAGGDRAPDRALCLAMEVLERQLRTEILPDGGVTNRSPAAQLHMLRYLIDIRAALKAAAIAIPDALRPTITAMVPALKFYRHGDGGLALFHGGHEETPLLIDAVITQAEGRSRVLRRLPETGFEKLTAGRSLLIADCAKPPARGYDMAAHAGLLSFEFGHGKERLIVNCGAVTGPAASGDWRTACAATAAHSTITVADTNACQVLSGGGVAGTLRVTSQRFEQDGMQCLDLSHDGYVAHFGVVHQRLLSLAHDGDALHGRDMLEDVRGLGASFDFALRWHLHPGVQVALGQNGQGALLRTASGAGWRLRVEGAILDIEPSVYCGSSAPRASRQIKLAGRMRASPTIVTWSLIKEKKV